MEWEAGHNGFCAPNAWVHSRRKTVQHHHHMHCEWCRPTYLWLTYDLHFAELTHDWSGSHRAWRRSSNCSEHWRASPIRRRRRQKVLASNPHTTEHRNSSLRTYWPMTYTIERFTQGVWAPVSYHKSKELAEAEIDIKVSILIDGLPIYRRDQLRIVTSTPD